VAISARILPICFLALAATAYGSDQAAALLGKWKVKSVTVPASGPPAEQAKSMLMSATIQFSRDRTFAMTLVGPMKGTWKVTGHTVALTFTDLLGRKMSEILNMARVNYSNEPSPRNRAVLDELSKPMIGILSSDGKTLTTKPPTGKSGIVFIRA